MTGRVIAPLYGGAFTVDQGEQGGDLEQARFVLPGEEVALPSLAVVAASPDRVQPGCRHFGECGGCHYQHASYPLQTTLKREVLEMILGVGVVVHGGVPWGYRSRVRVRVEGGRVGYSVLGSREFLPVVECPIAAPLVWRAVEAMVEVGHGSAVGRRWMPSIAEAEFHTNGEVVQMTVLTRDARTDGFAQFCEAIAGILPELVGGGTRGIAGEKERAGWGASGLSQRVLGRSYWVSRGGFFQVNRFLVDELVTLVTGGRSGGVAWDLYAGVGLFSRPLAEAFEKVVAVEANPIAAGDLARGAKKLPRVHAVEAETGAFLGRAVLDRERPELIVVDPPRAGLGAEVCGLLARIAAPEMVYVSCDPTTLARDLVMLEGAGYRRTEVHLVDLFPQTYHLETVVFLSLAR